MHKDLIIVMTISLVFLPLLFNVKNKLQTHRDTCKSTLEVLIITCSLFSISAGFSLHGVDEGYCVRRHISISFLLLPIYQCCLK